MKNIIKSVLCLALLAVMMLSFASCGKEHFGEFSYNGKWLTQHAKKALSASEIKELIQTISGYVTEEDEAPIVTLSVVGDAFITTGLDYPTLPKELQNSVLDKYGCLEVSTRYYEEDDDKETITPGEYRGTDLASIIAENKLSPFALVTAKNLILFDDVVDYMEKANEEFKKNAALTVPFHNIFTYHEDDDGNPVIQIHDFAELPSSTAGGVSSYYRQDIEMVYDGEGKLIKWQSSLGVYTATPGGTMKQGYILEMDFNWIVKE